MVSFLAQHIRVLKSGNIPYRPHCSRPVKHDFFLSYGPVHDAALGGALRELEAAEQEVLVHNGKLGLEPSPEMIAMRYTDTHRHAHTIYHIQTHIHT